jgi:hypothetical protein
MSKGSNSRPIQIPREQFKSNWEKTFGQKQPRPEHQPEPKK